MDEATTRSTSWRRRRMPACGPGGRLVVHDFKFDDEGIGPGTAALWFLQYLAFCPDAISFTGAALADRA